MDMKYGNHKRSSYILGDVILYNCGIPAKSLFFKALHQTRAEIAQVEDLKLSKAHVAD